MGKQQEQSFQDRLNELIESVAKSRREFAREIGDSAANVNNYANGTEPPAAFLTKVVERYPEVNLRWLLLGVGSRNVVDPGDDTMAIMAQLVKKFVQEGPTARRIKFTDLEFAPNDEGSIQFKAEGMIKADI